MKRIIFLVIIAIVGLICIIGSVIDVAFNGYELYHSGLILVGVALIMPLDIYAIFINKKKK